MSKFVAFLLIAFGASLANAQVIGIGNCDPAITPVKNFNATAYLGRWYENKRYFAIFEAGAKCVTADYSLNDDGSIKVVNTQVNSITNSQSNVVGKATFVEDNTVGKLAVKFPSSPVAGSYWVISTEYDAYSLVYSCSNILGAKTEFAWILTREANPDAAVVDKVIAAADTFGIDTSKFSKTTQENCKYATTN